MAKADVYNLQKKKVGELDLSDEVFAAEVKEHLLHEVVVAQLASRRAGTHAGKAGTVIDIHTSKSGTVTLTVVQINGERFKTLAKNVVVQK